MTEVTVRCYNTMGIPNSVGACGSCGATETYFPGRAKREGFKSDLDAAEAWVKKHMCPPKKEEVNGR